MTLCHTLAALLKTPTNVSNRLQEVLQEEKRYCKPVFDHCAGMSLIMRVCASKRDELDRLAAEEEFMEKEASAAVLADRPSTSQG